MRKRAGTDRTKIIDSATKLILLVLIAVMTISASVSFLLDQPFVKGFILLLTSIIFLSMIFGYKQIEVLWKNFKLRFNR